uniref:Uncharacterized protein n=1 Tax=Tetranychus urticae TaxID=32264 RepID=T1L253_TETUR
MNVLLVILVYCLILDDFVLPLTPVDYADYVCDYSYLFPEIDQFHLYNDDYGVFKFPNGLLAIKDYHNTWVCFPPLMTLLAKNGLYSEIHKVLAKPNYYDPNYDHIEGIKYADDTDDPDNNFKSTTDDNQISELSDNKNEHLIKGNNEEGQENTEEIDELDELEGAQDDEEDNLLDNDPDLDISGFLTLINPKSYE